MSRFRLYPTPAQEAQLLEHCGHARYIWNLALEQKLMWRPWRGYPPNIAEQSRQLTEARAAEPWLAAGPQVVQQQALRDLDQVWHGFLTGVNRRPGWRRKGRRDSFRIVNGHGIRVRQDNDRWSSVLIPKVGWVSFRRSRSLPAARSYRINRDRAGRWHVAFAAIPDPLPSPGTGEIAGVDLGVAVAVTISDGTMTSPLGLRPKEEERHRRLQRSLRRTQRDSNRRERARLRLARLRARDTARRKDWVEKTSTDLARRFDLIRVENLRIKDMTRSAKGTLAEPGRYVQQKSGLNREILSKGWGMLVRRLEHKAQGRVEKVDPRFTSQTCNACRHCAQENRKSQAVFLCVACGHRADADVNAACNIRDKEPTAGGRSVAARGDLAAGRSVKREPQRRRPAA